MKNPEEVLADDNWKVNRDAACNKSYGSEYDGNEAYGASQVVKNQQSLYREVLFKACWGVFHRRSLFNKRSMI